MRGTVTWFPEGASHLSLKQQDMLWGLTSLLFSGYQVLIPLGWNECSVKLNTVLHFLGRLEMNGGRYPLPISLLNVKRDKLSQLLFVLAGLNMWVAMMHLPSRKIMISNRDSRSIMSSAEMLYSGLSLLILWMRVSGQMKKRLLLLLSVPICISVCCWCRTSPSFVIRVWISCALTFALMMWDLRMSPTRNMRQSSPSRRHTTALRLNRSVWARCFGRASLANTMPTMKAETITPVTLCIHMTKIASGHSSVVEREPYLGKLKLCIFMGHGQKKYRPYTDFFCSTILRKLRLVWLIIKTIVQVKSQLYIVWDFSVP